jgi:sigma-B regulation protein RsbU (phosphoserine phosphatase)
MLGYTDWESLSATAAIALYVDPTERRRWQNVLEHEGVVRGFEIQLRKRDGTPIWVRDSARAVKDGTGKVLYYEGIWEDVTERRQAMEELGKLSSAVERTPDPVIIANADGEIEYVNRAFEKVSGFTAQDVVGKTPRILKSGTHPPEFYRHLWDTILAGKSWRGTFVNRRKDGQLYFSEASIAPVMSLDGRITHFVSVERDITERKQAEKALQEQAAEISDLYNNAPCGYHSLDTDEVFIRINDTELRWLGYTRDEIIGKKKFAEVLTSESARLFLNNFSLLKEQDSCRDLELQMVRKDGTILPVLSSATALKDSAGNLRMTHTTVFDITERQALRRLEEQESRAAQEREIARQVQARLFPQTAPVLESLEYGGTCAQASLVGGDYFDFLDLGSGQVGLVVADLSGKGLSAALPMASLHAVLRAERYLALGDLPRMLRMVNNLLYESTDANVFASLFLGVYEESDRCLRYANCGHNPPLLFPTSGTVEQLTETCPVLGILQNWECSTAEVKLAPGDILVAYTDGVVEAGNEAMEEFGVARLAQTVQANRHLSVSSLLTLIGTAVRDFSPGRQGDDQTLVVARGR